jgi:hypothetical protein
VIKDSKEGRYGEEGDSTTHNFGKNKGRCKDSVVENHIFYLLF